jgi:hypothetical protein
MVKVYNLKDRIMFSLAAYKQKQMKKYLWYMKQTAMTRWHITLSSHAYSPVRLAYQPPAISTFLSEQISHQQSANSTFLSEQISTSDQPRAARIRCNLPHRTHPCLTSWEFQGASDIHRAFPDNHLEPRALSVGWSKAHAHRSETPSRYQSHQATGIASKSLRCSAW